MIGHYHKNSSNLWPKNFSIGVNALPTPHKTGPAHNAAQLSKLVSQCAKGKPIYFTSQTSSTTANPDKRKDMSNCREMISERLQVQWEVHEDRIQIQLSANIRPDQYIAFGISGEHKR